MTKQVSKYRSRQAHEQAVREGYTGTIEEFRAALVDIAAATRRAAVELGAPVHENEAFNADDGFAIQAGIMLVEEFANSSAALKLLGDGECPCEECAVVLRYIAKLRGLFPKVVADIESDAHELALRDAAIGRAFKEAIAKNPNATAQQMTEYVAAALPPGAELSAVRLDRARGKIDVARPRRCGPPKTGPEPGVN